MAKSSEQKNQGARLVFLFFARCPKNSDAWRRAILNKRDVYRAPLLLSFPSFYVPSLLSLFSLLLPSLSLIF